VGAHSRCSQANDEYIMNIYKQVHWKVLCFHSATDVKDYS